MVPACLLRFLLADGCLLMLLLLLLLTGREARDLGRDFIPVLETVRAEMGPAVQDFKGHEVLSQKHANQDAIFFADELFGLTALFFDE